MLSAVSFQIRNSITEDKQDRDEKQHVWFTLTHELESWRFNAPFYFVCDVTLNRDHTPHLYHLFHCSLIRTLIIENKMSLTPILQEHSIFPV